MSAVALTRDQTEMMEANLGLVGFFLGKWRVPAYRWDDAFQDGCVGLASAVRKYDPARDIRFSTYAEHWIRQGVQRGQGHLEGVDFRRSMDTQRGGEWVPALSIDAEVPGTDLAYSTTLVAVDDPAEAATTRASLDALRAALTHPVDVALVDALLAAPDAPGVHQAVADACGVSREHVRRRHHQIAQRFAA